MADSKIPKVLSNQSVYVYSDNSGTFSNEIGSILQLSSLGANYSFLILSVFISSIASSNRRTILIPTCYHNVNASYFLYGAPTGYGSLRVEIAGDKLTLLSCTEGTLWVNYIMALE